MPILVAELFLYTDNRLKDNLLDSFKGKWKFSQKNTALQNYFQGQSLYSVYLCMYIYMCFARWWLFKLIVDLNEQNSHIKKNTFRELPTVRAAVIDILSTPAEESDSSNTIFLIFINK